MSGDRFERVGDLIVLRPGWPAPPRVRAAVTTRLGGVSVAPYHSLNLGTHVGDAAAAVVENRRRLRSALGLPAEPPWLSQVHGTRTVPAEGAAGCEADAVTGGSPGQVCAVLTADCLPVLFCNAAGSRVAAAHAGWRGLQGGVLERSIEALGEAPGAILAWLGPAIGPEVYEVGDEVRAAFVADQPGAEAAFQRSGEHCWLADLYRLARLRLEAMGVGGIFGGGHCTFSDSEHFYSYRRDGTTGRMASLVWLEP